MGLLPSLVVAKGGSPWGVRGLLSFTVLMALSTQAQQETQKAALRYERAVSMHNAAREMVFVAEQGVMADKNRLDPTWQEMLNHATCKVSQAVVAGPLQWFQYFVCHPFILSPFSFLFLSSPQLLFCSRQNLFLAPCPNLASSVSHIYFFCLPSGLFLNFCLQVWN